MVLLHMFILHLSYQGRIQDIGGGGGASGSNLFIIQPNFPKKEKEKLHENEEIKAETRGRPKFYHADPLPITWCMFIFNHRSYVSKTKISRFTGLICSSSYKLFFCS